MSYSIADDYSAFNNYNYDKKPLFLSTLDWLSTPCRTVFGGRSVDILSQMYENKKSTLEKVKTLFYSILIFPIAFVSIASLVIKLATFPFIWEKKIVKAQSQQAWKVINEFNEAFKDKEFGKAIQSLIQRPEILDRTSIYDKLFHSLNQLINDSKPWEEIQTSFHFLKNDDALKLINHAVKVKLSDEFKNERYRLQAKDIEHFVQNALAHKSISNIQACFEILFSDALQVNVEEDYIQSAIKMDIADHLMKSLTRMRVSEAKTELERVSALAEETLLRYSIFQREQSFNNHFLILSDSENMPKISIAVQNLRLINKLGNDYLSKLEDISGKGITNQQIYWNDIRSEFFNFQGSLEKIAGFTQEEKKYLETLNNIFANIIKFIDAIGKTTSEVEIESLVKEIMNNLNEQVENLHHLSQDTKKTTVFQTNAENLLSTLCFKLKADVFIFTEKMKALILNQMTKTLIS